MAAKQLSGMQKAALEQFRVSKGGVSEAQRTEQRRHTQERKAVLGALAGEPVTVPEIAAASGLAPARVLWHLTAMRKYGGIREVELDGDYVRYARTPDESAGQG